MKDSYKRVLVRLGWWLLYAVVWILLGMWIGVELATRATGD